MHATIAWEVKRCATREQSNNMVEGNTSQSRVDGHPYSTTGTTGAQTMDDLGGNWSHQNFLSEQKKKCDFFYVVLLSKYSSTKET